MVHQQTGRPTPPRLTCIGPIIVDKYVPPRGKPCLVIFGKVISRGTEFIRCEVVFPALAVLHRALSPVATLMRIGSDWPSILATVESELRVSARGASWSVGEEGGERSRALSDAVLPDLSTS